MTLVNKYICALGRTVVWKKRQKSGSFEKVKIDINHFLDNKNSLIISNLTLDDAGIYEAYDEDNPGLVVAKYRLQVVTGMFQMAKFASSRSYFVGTQGASLLLVDCILLVLKKQVASGRLYFVGTQGAGLLLVNCILFVLKVKEQVCFW